MGSLIVLMGPTGAGKSAQGDLLAENYQAVHLSSGTLLRQDAHAAATLADGRLAPASEVERVIGEAMAKVPDNKMLILDGMPRTESNVKWLDRNLRIYHRHLVKVVLIELDIETSMTRLSHRGRADDTVQAVKEKWQLFDEVTRPVVGHYRDLGLLVSVDGRGTISEVHQLMKQALTGIVWS